MNAERREPTGVGAAGAGLFLAMLFVPILAPAGAALRGADPGHGSEAGSVSVSPAFHAANSMSPPAASTGGFGEDTCAFCHIDFELNEEGGTLEVLGLPDSGYTPGRTVELEVRIHHPELRRAGFQLTTRFAEGQAAGEQAGALAAGEGQRLQAPGYTTIQYLGHGLDGIEPTAEGERRWRFEWTPPAAEPAGAGPRPVVFHVSANAADGDGMEWGDRTYTHEVVLPPAR